MKKHLILFVILSNIILAQTSIWQVYISPYRVGNTYYIGDNTTTGTPMSWWKKNLTYYYDTNVPWQIKTGFSYAINSSTSWGSVYSTTGVKLFNFSEGNSNTYDIKIQMEFETRTNDGYDSWYGRGDIDWDKDNGTGQINRGLITLNNGKRGENGTDYYIIHTTDGRNFTVAEEVAMLST